MLGLLVAGLAQAAIPASERAVLDNLFASTHGQGWTEKDHWGEEPGSECIWYGIDCDTVDGSEHIVAIDLIQNNLSGPLPALANLTHLRHFFVPINSLTGGIPPLNAMTELRTFVVFANLLDGALPALTGMSQLTTFDVSINQLRGGIPELSGLVQLDAFDVSDNELRGAVPALDGLTNLRFFEIGGNHPARPTRAEQPDSGQFEVVHQPRTQRQRTRADAKSGLEYREWFNAVVLGMRYRNDLRRWL